MTELFYADRTDGKIVESSEKIKEKIKAINDMKMRLDKDIKISQKYSDTEDIIEWIEDLKKLLDTSGLDFDLLQN